MAVPGHYIDAYLTPRKKLLDSKYREIRISAEKYGDINFNAIEHRIMMAILSGYNENGYSREVFTKGMVITPHQLCSRMGYVQNSLGLFGRTKRTETLSALVGLSKKLFTVCFLKFKRRGPEGDVYDTVTIPYCSLLDIIYESSDVTEQDLKTGKVLEKASRIHVRIKPIFYNENYYKLFETNFYARLKSYLEKQNRRVSGYHFNFALWYLRQKHHKKPIEINVDKLAMALKVPNDVAHRTRARTLVRKLCEDFKAIGYISNYRINEPAQNGGTKDIILLAAKLG
jgi:hypothetical protein